MKDRSLHVHRIIEKTYIPRRYDRYNWPRIRVYLQWLFSSLLQVSCGNTWPNLSYVLLRVRRIHKRGMKATFTSFYLVAISLRVCSYVFMYLCVCVCVRLRVCIIIIPFQRNSPTIFVCMSLTKWKFHEKKIMNCAKILSHMTYSNNFWILYGLAKRVIFFFSFVFLCVAKWYVRSNNLLWKTFFLWRCDKTLLPGNRARWTENSKVFITLKI